MSASVRIGIVGALFLALLGVLTLRLWTMQVTEVQAYEERAESNQIRLVSTPAPRGDIYDRNGVKLAGTRSALAAVIDLALVESSERKDLAENLAAFLDQPASDILLAMEEDAQGAQLTVAEDLSDAQATFLVEHREQFPGVNIIPQPVRTYPEGEVAAHLIGYIGRPNDEDLERPDVRPNDFVGKAGVEKSYDSTLRGTEGTIQYQVDARRKVLSLVGEQPPTAGGSLQLTIDAELQQQLQDSLRDGLAQARRLEMDERDAEIAAQSIDARMAEALAEARREAAEALLSEPAGDQADAEDAQIGADDDDVEIPDEEITVDRVEVLASLNPHLPVGPDEICIPIERVDVGLGESAPLSGREPRIIRVDSITEFDGTYEATVSIGLDRHTVRQNSHFGETLQVLAIGAEEVVLYHRDPWCPVRSVGVVLDPNDGSVLAMSSYPTYDPSIFVGGVSSSEFASLATVSAFTNFGVQGLYAPASTFKTVPYILALEEDYYPPDRGAGDVEIGQADDDGGAAEPVEPLPLQSSLDEYNCSGEFRFTLNDGTVQRKRDWKWPQGHGPLDLHGALQASCDLYFWDLALRLWNERGDGSGVDKENLLQVYSRGFGFGEVTGIDLPFERAGLIPDRDWFRDEQQAETGRVRTEGGWVGGDLMDIAVGQGATLSTPLQLANGYAAMVNGGTVWQPRVVSEVRASDGTVIETFPEQVLSTIDLAPATVAALKTDLQQVVNNSERGTARSAFVDFGPNVDLVGGKTGTGEVIKAPREEAFRQSDSAFFVGVAPIDDPEYVVSIVVERGGSGGRVAAPVARQVLQYLMNGADGVTELAPGLDAD